MQYVISLAGILLVVGLVWLLFRKPLAPVAPEEAIAAANDALPGFRGIEALSGRSGRGALVADTDGRIAIVQPHGDHFSVRLAEPGLRAEQDGDTLILRPAEPMFPVLRLDAGEAASAWLDRLRKSTHEPA